MTVFAKRIKLPYIFLIGGLVLAVAIFLLENQVAHGANWYDSLWTERGTVVIDNSSNGSTLTNHLVAATVNTSVLIAAGKMRTDCGDMRITDTDGTTLLNFWIVDNTCNTTATEVWIKVPTLTASTALTTYMYYGNPAASTVSSWANTILPYTDHQLTSTTGQVRYDGGMLNFNGKLWVFGGRINANTTGSRVNDVWSSTDGITWSQVTAAAGWSARSGLGAAVFNNKMWVLGGRLDGSVYKNDVWSSSDGSTWAMATGTAEWPVRNEFGVAAFNNKLWVFGGNAGSNLHDVWSSSDGIAWTQATSSAEWSARQMFASTVFNNKMWIFGGATAVANNDVWSSSDGIAWTQVTNSANWGIRSGLLAAVLDNKMWIAGGFGSGTTYHDLWYSDDGATWTSATAAGNWSGRNLANMISWNEKLIVANGNSSGSFVGDVWQLMRPYTSPQPATSVTPYQAPPDPSGVTAASSTASGVTVSWTDNSNNEIAFVLSQSTDGVTFSAASTTVANATSAVLTGLTANTSYTFAVTASSTFAQSSSVQSAPIYTLANVPTALSGISQKTDIALTWTGDATQYYVENTTNHANSGWIAASTYTAQNLTCNTAYNFHIKGKNVSDVETAYGDTVTISTAECAANLSNPGAAQPVGPTTAGRPPSSLKILSLTEDDYLLGWSGNSQQYQLYNETADSSTPWFADEYYTVEAPPCGLAEIYKVRGRDYSTISTDFSNELEIIGLCTATSTEELPGEEIHEGSTSTLPVIPIQPQVPLPIPEPIISSQTHPNQQVTYQDRNFIARWGIPDDITAVSVVFDTKADTIAPINSSSTRADFFVIQHAPIGCSYLHVRFGRDGEWGSTAHFKLCIMAPPVPISVQPQKAVQPFVAPIPTAPLSTSTSNSTSTIIQNNASSSISVPSSVLFVSQEGSAPVMAATPVMPVTPPAPLTLQQFITVTLPQLLQNIVNFFRHLLNGNVPDQPLIYRLP